ncbi:hypothetical protein GCM10010430_30450 [Kitasatospora cystarginea]|uniref:Molecular chaperone DnaJ n=1 Tax=Kitasatospora cystarginea TaxID=58350 RepID=A0ABN3E1I1_9ACTN
MPQHNHAPGRICPNCDGFARAAIDTGTRHPDGTRTTVHAWCPACHGTGTVPARTAALTTARG